MAGDKLIREDQLQLQLQPIWFAAGTAAFMACVERAVVVSLFAHWRVWAFLALNLLLLAILFTSKISQIPPNNNKTDQNNQENVVDPSEISSINRKKERVFIKPSPIVPVEEEPEKIVKSEEEEEEKEEDGDLKLQEAPYEISKEELNQRVEAFIAMFRQQYLVSDATKGKSFGQVVSPGRRRRSSFSHSYVGVST